MEGDQKGEKGERERKRGGEEEGERGRGYLSERGDRKRGIAHALLIINIEK